MINAVPHIEYKLKDADSYFYTWKGAQGEDAGKALTLGLWGKEQDSEKEWRAAWVEDAASASHAPCSFIWKG